jgi:hypothetical protein
MGLTVDYKQTRAVQACVSDDGKCNRHNRTARVVDLSMSGNLPPVLNMDFVVVKTVHS